MFFPAMIELLIANTFKAILNHLETQKGNSQKAKGREDGGRVWGNRECESPHAGNG